MSHPTAIGALLLSSLLLSGLGVASSQEPEPPRFFGQACAPPAAPAPPPPEPLFTPATVGPDTPPLLLRLLLEPTADNAKAFAEWQYARQIRMMEVQGLSRELSRQGP